jgi:hypothetical protein
MLYEMLKKKKKRKLEDIDVEEISLVDRGANRHTFAIVKRDAELAELLSAFADEGIEELMKAGDEKALKAALKSALEKLKPYMEGLPDDIAAAVKTLAAFAMGPTSADGKDYGYGYPAKGEQKDAEKEGAEVKKSFGGIPGTLDALVHTIVGAARPDIVNRWQGKRVQKAIDDGDIVLEEVIDETEGEPHSHGVSKSLKGQGDDDDEAGADETEDHWPSL